MHRDRAHCNVALSEQERTESRSGVRCIPVRSPWCVESLIVTTLDFVYQTRPSRVVFGGGSLQHLEREVLMLGAERALILSTPEQRGSAEAIATRLGARAAGVFARAVMHVPIEVAREAREVAQSPNADCAIAIGGGSTIGLGKAIALESGLSVLAIPTTYAGSEMTPIYGITEGGLKRTGADGRVLRKTVIYDPELTSTRMELGSPERCWATSAWRCTTSSVIRLAAASISRTRRCTRSFCRTPSHTTLPRHPTRCGASRERWAAAMPHREPMTLRGTTAPRWH